MNVLFLCTGNSARSILAEVLLRDLGIGRFTSMSAGSKPKGVPHPCALEVLTGHGHDITGLRSKSWDEFSGEGAPQIDIVLTACGNAAGEVCPVWPGAPMRAHWGIEDPADIEGPSAEQTAAFEKAYAQMKARVGALLALPEGGVTAASLARIGEMVP